MHQTRSEDEAAIHDLTAKRCHAWREYVRSRGERYERCRFDNFEISSHVQALAIDRLRSHAGATDNQENLILLGPSGTGKDHLLTASVHMRIGMSEKIPSIEWTSGPKLFAALRSAIANHESEWHVLDPLKKAGLLVISDLAMTTLTDYQREIVYLIVDARYSSAKPIWLSANVSSRSALEDATSVQIVDRLVHGATYVSCNWTTYRGTAKP